jgi:hypothetical protein
MGVTLPRLIGIGGLAQDGEQTIEGRERTRCRCSPQRPRKARGEVHVIGVEATESHSGDRAELRRSCPARGTRRTSWVESRNHEFSLSRPRGRGDRLRALTSADIRPVSPKKSEMKADASKGMARAWRRDVA